VDEVPFGGLGVIVAAGSVLVTVAGESDEILESCIARPMKPPIRPATMAIESPARASIHHFVNVSRAGTGVLCVLNSRA
jgi:hypothetical protein